jgi:NADH-quinone oxidoreductase subunit F
MPGARLMERPLTRNVRPGQAPLNLDGYRRAGGYETLRATLGKTTPADLIAMVTASGLGGCGGGGFSTGRKWQAMPDPKSRPGPRYFIVNADEMEPGTFKDRLLLEGDPHQLLEGLILSAYAVQADHGIIFIRAEYTAGAELLNRALAEAQAAGLLGENILGTGFNLHIHLHASAGRYICGEETALLNALEGKRAIPRAKPPLPQTSGLFGHPTVVNNVETLCNIPHIIGRGVDWYRGLGTGGEAGTKIFGVSGRVRYPGAYELPIGTPLRELIEDHAGGMCRGYNLRAVLPGGASTGFMLDSGLDIPMSFGAFAAAGHRLGTGTAIVLDDRTCPVAFIANLQHFFAQESCGWCAPCRDGLPWVEQTLQAIEAGDGTEDDLDLLMEMTGHLGPGRTFCALAPGAMASLKTGLILFGRDFNHHIHNGGCAWH